MSGQPNIPGNWVFDVVAEAVEVDSGTGAISPGIVVEAPNNLTVRSTIYNSDGTHPDGGLSNTINGTAGHVRYFATKLNAPAPVTVALSATPFTMTRPHPQIVNSGLFTTDGTPGGLDAGTWLISVMVDFQGDPAFEKAAAAFTQILLMVI